MGSAHIHRTYTPGAVLSASKRAAAGVLMGFRSGAHRIPFMVPTVIAPPPAAALGRIPRAVGFSPPERLESRIEHEEETG